MAAGIKDNETNECQKKIQGPKSSLKCHNPVLDTGLPTWGHLINDATEMTLPSVLKAEKGLSLPPCLLT